ncbi:hypothetical protein [Streptomyces sp. NPDC013457]|uniref:hypothetical protein n=1 Tax=Streptomyces sp. NPDC013457 TaxID=3364866 RepID=UPI0036FA75DA
MSIMSSIPVLRGRDATVRCSEQEELVLERPAEKLTIPLRAVARVHAEARTVTVELRALAGAVPTAHRVEDVSAAAAAAFADAVNALLPQPVEDIDGGAVVGVRTFTETWLQTFRHGLRRVMLGYLGALLALAVTTAIAGPERTAVAGAVFIVPLGLLAAAFLWIGVVCVVPWFRQLRLRRHGVTVDAVQADEPGTYRYTDGTGVTRLFSHPATTPSVPAAYDARNAAKVLVLQDPSTRLIDITLGSCFLLAGLATTAAPIGLAVMTILDKQLP